MNIKYFSETDTALIEFTNNIVSETREISENIYIDFDSNGNIVNITIESGKVILSEKSAWELEVQSIDSSISSNLMLNKKFLSCIDEDKDVEFNIFENFMLIQDENSNLMLSFEQSFDDD